MEDYIKKYYPAYPPEPPEQKSKIDSLPLFFRIPIYFIMVITLIPTFVLAYLFSMPIERFVFLVSGYSKLYPKYYWLITRTTHYKIFRRYSKKHFAYCPNFFGKVMYIYEKNDVLSFILTDFDGMYYWEKANDWVVKGGHGSIGFAAFYAMEQYGNEKYPGKDKQYCICLSKRDLKRGMKEKDARFLEIGDVENLIQRGAK